MSRSSWATRSWSLAIRSKAAAGWSGSCRSTRVRSGCVEGDVVDDEAGLEAGVLGAGEGQGHGLSGVGGDVEGLLGVAGGGVEVAVGGQGGAADLDGEFVVGGGG